MKKLINIFSSIFIIFINVLLYLNISLVLFVIVLFYGGIFLAYAEDTFGTLLILVFVYIPLFIFLFILHWQIKLKGLIKLYNYIIVNYSDLYIAKKINNLRTNKKWQKTVLWIAFLLDIAGVILLFMFYRTANMEQTNLSIFIMVMTIYLLACGGLFPSYFNLFKQWNSDTHCSTAQ